jgi:hypothetical protein
MAPQSKKLKMSSSSSDAVEIENTHLPTLRSIPTTVSAVQSAAIAETRIREITASMNQRAKDMAVFTEDEVMGVVHSLQNVVPAVGESSLDFDKLRAHLKAVAHLSHKDWSVTGKNSERLGEILLPAGSSGMTGPAARQMLERILSEGNWDGAASAAAHNTAASAVKPWAVLVTVRTVNSGMVLYHYLVTGCNSQYSLSIVFYHHRESSKLPALSCPKPHT